MNQTEHLSAEERGRLVSLIRRSSRPLEPLPLMPGELPADWERTALRGASLRAVLFDLYGTLFISAAGDIASGSGAAEDGAAVDAGMSAWFRAAVKARHARAHAAGVAWPEVRVEEIWAEYSAQGKTASPLVEDNSTKEACSGGAERSREIALRYECAVNPVYPMPDALETIRALRGQGFILGIISNAQFFSPLLFDAFFGAAPAALGFDPGLLIYSFEAGEAKPSPALFARALDALAQRGVKAAETLYMGNDLRNDITGAAAAGMKTCLFAGDRRSLRLRPDERGYPRPDMTVRSLADAARRLRAAYAGPEAGR
ncbi:MAG: HAD family hydrolase [Treponema sp.]|jgi:putative hydrolase of the HAD superfamily|nr:HAD family hydrolase [Treponema sp.]